MKNLFILLCAYIFLPLTVFAETIIGTSLADFSTEKPSKTYAVKLDEGIVIDNYINYPAHTILYGNVSEVINARRGKRKAFFCFVPTHYISPKGEQNIVSKRMEIKVSYHKPFDKESSAKKIAESGILVYVNHYIPMFSQGVSFVKGAVIKPEEDKNRIVSGLHQIYKDSPLTYIEKGDELDIQAGQEVKLKMYLTD